MFEKTKAQELNNKDVLVQINELLASLPEKSKSFYQEILNKESPFDPDLFHTEVFVVINYELIFLSLQKKDIKDITHEDLNLLTPWVRPGNQNNWVAMLSTSSPESVFPWLDQILKSRQKILTLPTEKHKSEDLENMVPDMVELDKKYKLELAQSLESTKMTCYSALLSIASNFFSINANINSLMNSLKKEIQQHQFYQDLLTKGDNPEFRSNLLKALRMELAMCSIDEKLEMTPPKLDILIKMLDADIRKNYENRNTSIEPAKLFQELKTDLNQKKTDLITQLQLLELKAQQEKERQAQMLKEQQERARQAQEQKAQQEKEYQERLFKEKQEALRQAPMLKILQNINFDSYLKRFENKAAKFKGNHRKDYIQAFNAANVLINDLKTAKINFLNSDQSIDKSTIIFKQACRDAITRASTVLKQHRGWKQALADFTSLIVSILTVGAANIATGRGLFGLFPTKTDSQKLIDNFEEALLFKGLNNSAN